MPMWVARIGDRLCPGGLVRLIRQERSGATCLAISEHRLLTIVLQPGELQETKMAYPNAFCFEKF
jgi:hypothetical protein